MNSIVLKFLDGMMTTTVGDVELDSGIAEVITWRKRAFVFDGTEGGHYFYREVTIAQIK